MRQFFSAFFEKIFRAMPKLFAVEIFKDNKDFSDSSIILLLHRLKITSITLVILYPYYVYFDLILLRNVKDTIFSYTLIAIHLLGLVMSIIYLYVNRTTNIKKRFLSSIWPVFIISTYAFLYILMGAIASINSARFNQNNDGYLIMLISVAVIFPIQPKRIFPILLFNHIIFLIALFILSKNASAFFIKQANPTLAVVIAFVISCTFYSYRKKEFINRLKLKEDEENFRKLFDVNPYPILLTRVSNGSIVKMNSKALEFYGFSCANINKIDICFLYKDINHRLAIIKELKKSGSIKNHIVEQNTSSNLTKWVMINCELINYENEECILTAVIDITELKKTEEELTKHASIDLLTGITNRRSGMEVLQNALLKAQSTYLEFILCFIDVNNLKIVNDTFGHREGDYLVSSISQVIKNEIEETDLFFRYGGDEFIVIFFDKQPAEVQTIWDKINYAFHQLNQSKNKPYNISVSYGLYEYKSGMDMSLEEIIESADKEMYQQKKLLKKGDYGKDSEV